MEPTILMYSFGDPFWSCWWQPYAVLQNLIYHISQKKRGKATDPKIKNKNKKNKSRSTHHVTQLTAEINLKQRSFVLNTLVIQLICL